MPKTIREALSARVSTLPDLRQFLDDFALATGIPVHFVTVLGSRMLGSATCRLCRFLHGHPSGARLCSTFLLGLLEQSLERSAQASCDAGLTETAVPLRTGGQTFGFLVLGHCAPHPQDRVAFKRARHLLGRAGISISAAEFELLARDTPTLDAQRQAALVRLVEAAAERLVMGITQKIIHPPSTMPALVKRACRLVRAEHDGPMALPDLARRLGVSSAHLSRVFHRSTGLRFVEYVARVRADRARTLLIASEQPITDIAFACGFQSLSQFNRTMKTLFGCRPRDLRTRYASMGTSDAQSAGSMNHT